MHHISTLILFMTILIVINARVNSPSNNYRSCPEEYRELRRRSDDSSSDSNDEQWEEMCDIAMAANAQHRNDIKNLALLRTYCAHFDEALELARANNDTLCEDKKRAITFKRHERKAKRHEIKKKRDDDSSDDDDDEDKRRALRKRELHKRFALRFIRK